ncbi:tripartite tricarboxylate transporter substrate binding protein [Verticiella sediminum]|uniref:Tripartite tricarboxylate transporter substrate binding protein n=1 Tax=Verticiella sediminum TaxID=1247510 RepID=A0A556AXD7_9BURK|nr:tripartite tricarboxylate transporter substrate binding protein [Verticiella sediminum]TSH97608.1 tripartite tricarboxylate transporter substrate binding protein [Verticiella sediminum]
MHHTLRAALGGALTCLALASMAHAAFPERPITLIVPYAPGGSADQLARATAQGMSERLGQPVVVENKPGANTQIAATQLTRAAPDGYTLLMASSASAVLNPLLYRSLSYDPAQIQTFAVIAEIPMVAVVNPSVPASDVPGLVAYDKANPGKLNYASVGRGNPVHLAAEMLKGRADMQAMHVPYNGSAPALTALMAGDVQFMMDVVSTSLPLIRAGKLKALAVTSAERLAPLPDTPTIAESGYPGYQATTWFGLAAPAGTPPAALDVLREAADAAMQNATFRETFNGLGLIVQQPRSRGEIRTYLDQDQARWREVIATNQIVLD